MNKYNRFLSGEQFYRHPKEECVLRTQPTGVGGWHTFVRFSGEMEYQAISPNQLVIDSLFKNEPEWITKEEYYNF